MHLQERAAGLGQPKLVLAERKLLVLMLHNVTDALLLRFESCPLRPCSTELLL